MKKVIVTGACGFIGSCLSRRLLKLGHEVIGIDNLSRRGTEIHAAELASQKHFNLIRTDLCHPQKLWDAAPEIGSFDALFHLAAQVAVTTSYLNRNKDFQDNAVASFNVIEWAKRFSPDAYCLYASTNKVYGHLTVNTPVGSSFNLNPYTPYGVSKAVGELYFTEYGRPEIGLTTCSLRQSCIYGPHQYGVEDQGWLAWFAIANLLELPITIYGDGQQIRDLLFVEDLVDLYLECWSRRWTGAHPVGGGPGNAINLLQGLNLIEKATGKPFKNTRKEGPRPGDQPYFVADLEWATTSGFDWKPKTTVAEGLDRMVAWLQENEPAVRQLFKLPPAGA